MSTQTLEPRALRDAFGAFMTGVTVVATTNAEGDPIGFTANSFSSVSLDPPLLLVCLAKSSRNYQTLMTAPGFAVNILSEDQKDVSNTFARPVEDRFAAVDWKKGPFGSPVFAGVAAWFDCSAHDRVDAGDHVILIGKVEGFENFGSTGLGYARGGYFTPALTEKNLLSNVEGSLSVGVVAERAGEILLVPDAGDGWTLPSVDKAESEGIEALEPQFTAGIGLSIQTGLLFSIYEDTKAGRQHIVYRAALGEGAPRQGQLFSLQHLPLDKIQDSAIRETVKRYAQESTLGNFGIYFGNQEKGRVHAVAKKG